VLGRAGQCGRHGTHLLKVACEAAAGLRDGVTVHGANYPTPDGTCVRDYIHVSDLAAIQVAVLRGIENGEPNRVLNCGYGRGFSVREVLGAVRAEAGAAFEVRDGPRRPGDPPVVVGDTRLLRRAVDWSPRHDDLALIVRSALAWERRRNAGRAAGCRER
jgi:UDP-glucose 4-epimerase